MDDINSLLDGIAKKIVNEDYSDALIDISKYDPEILKPYMNDILDNCDFEGFLVDLAKTTPELFKGYLSEVTGYDEVMRELLANAPQVLVSNLSQVIKGCDEFFVLDFAKKDVKSFSGFIHNLIDEGYDDVLDYITEVNPDLLLSELCYVIKNSDESLILDFAKKDVKSFSGFIPNLIDSGFNEVVEYIARFSPDLLSGNINNLIDKGFDEAVDVLSYSNPLFFKDSIVKLFDSDFNSVVETVAREESILESNFNLITTKMPYTGLNNILLQSQPVLRNKLSSFIKNDYDALVNKLLDSVPDEYRDNVLFVLRGKNYMQLTNVDVSALFKNKSETPYPEAKKGFFSRLFGN